jgi:hypothetical protein
MQHQAIIIPGVYPAVDNNEEQKENKKDDDDLNVYDLDLEDHFWASVIKQFHLNEKNNKTDLLAENLPMPPIEEKQDEIVEIVASPSPAATSPTKRRLTMQDAKNSPPSLSLEDIFKRINVKKIGDGLNNYAGNRVRLTGVFYSEAFLQVKNIFLLRMDNHKIKPHETVFAFQAGCAMGPLFFAKHFGIPYGNIDLHEERPASANLAYSLEIARAMNLSSSDRRAIRGNMKFVLPESFTQQILFISTAAMPLKTRRILAALVNRSPSLYFIFFVCSNSREFKQIIELFEPEDRTKTWVPCGFSSHSVSRQTVYVGCAFLATLNNTLQ